MKTKKTNALIGIFVVAVLVVAAFFIMHGNTLSFINTASCNNCQSVGQIVGGIITSIQNVQFLSNYASLNGAAYLVTFVINGAGQALQGTQAQLAQGINSSYATHSNNQVSINYKLNSEQIEVPYTYSGYHLYQWGYTPINTGWTNSSCPFGLVCSNSYPSGDNYNTTIAAGVYVGSIPEAFIAQEVSSYANACASSGASNPIVVMTGQGTISGLIASSEAVSLMCVAPVQSSVATVYNPGAYKLLINASITFTNSTTTATVYLNSQQPSAYYDSTLYAQIYGYTSSGRNIITSFPTVVVFTNGTDKVVNTFDAGALLSSTVSYTGAFPSGWIAGQNPLELQGVRITNVYSWQALTGAIQQSNQDLNNYLYAPQATSSASGMKIYLSGGSPYGVLNITSNPEFYPEVQLVAKLSTLGVYIPVVEPKIQSVSPNPTSFQSGSAQTVTFDVYNNASVAGGAYISGSCGSSTFSTPNFNVGAGQTVPISTSITSPYNPNLANEDITCIATVYSSSYSIYHNNINFQAVVKPNCPSGYIYQNNANCAPISPTLNNTNSTNVCAGGYKYENGACVPVNVCPTGYYLNSTVVPPTCDPSPVSQGIGWGWYLLAGVIIVAAVYLLSRGTGKGKSRVKVAKQ
jgi:hypothetical protein